MGAKTVPFQIYNVSRLRLNALSDEPAVVAIRDKADVLAVRLVCHGKAQFPGNLPDAVLGVLTNRKHQPRKLLLPEPVENVALVLPRVPGLQKPESAPGPLDSRVVSCRQFVRAQGVGTFHQEPELHLLIAGNARVGSPPLSVLLQEVFDDLGPELLLEVLDVVRYTQNTAYPASICGVLRGAAPLVLAAFGDRLRRRQTHGDADYIVASVLEQVGTLFRATAIRPRATSLTAYTPMLQLSIYISTGRQAWSL